jgi:hypothetical protein
MAGGIWINIGVAYKRFFLYVVMYHTAVWLVGQGVTVHPSTFLPNINFWELLSWNVANKSNWC